MALNVASEGPLFCPSGRADMVGPLGMLIACT